MVKQLKFRSRKPSSQSAWFKFYLKYKYFIWLLIGSIIIVGTIFLVLYITKQGPFADSSGSKPTHPPPGPTPGPGPGPGPTPVKGKIVGSWVNVSSPPFQQMSTQDLVMLASYSPNPWSTLYPCQSGFSMFPKDFSVLKALVTQARTKGKQILLSIGGSSFGLPEWQDMLYKYTGSPSTGDCQCDGGYWFGCTGDPKNCCSDKDKAAGKCGGVYTVTSKTGQPCCPGGHQCCCGNNKKLEPIDPTKPDGPQQCVSNVKIPDCPHYGVIPGKETILKACLDDPNKSSSEKHKCILDNTDPVLAYVKCLEETGADGIDFDFESPDPAGVLATALVKFAADLKTAMAAKGKQIYLSITPLSGASYQAQYHAIYDSLKTSTSPFDYAIPMLYNGGQYPYGSAAQPPAPPFTWNSLLDYWRKSVLVKGVSNTKLIAAFIEYQSKPAFECGDLQHFLQDYIVTPKDDGGNNVDGVVYFYYSTDYNIALLETNLNKTKKCFQDNQCTFSC